VAKRKSIPIDIQLSVLTQAGYRCAVPTCRGILALDLHHMVEVSEGGENTEGNLLPLCPTCHALYTRGTIKKESIYTWKGMLVSLGRAFDQAAIDVLLYLDLDQSDLKNRLVLSGDTILKHGGLVIAGLVEVYEWSYQISQNTHGGSINVGTGKSLRLTENGKALVHAWKNGDRDALKSTLGAPSVS